MYIRKGNIYEIGMERKGAKYMWLSGFAKSDSRFFMFGFDGQFFAGSLFALLSLKLRKG